MTTYSNLMEDERGRLLPDPDPADLKRREEEAAREAEWTAAVQRREQQIDELCDEIDVVMAPFLKGAMALENQQSRISKGDKKRLEEFKAYCANFDPPLPSLPARSQAVAAFLCKHLDRGPIHLARLARSISNVHLALNFSDPCTDILVRGLLRFSREMPSPSEPQTQEGS
jgi:hypothetical protein